MLVPPNVTDALKTDAENVIPNWFAPNVTLDMLLLLKNARDAQPTVMTALETKKSAKFVLLDTS